MKYTKVEGAGFSSINNVRSIGNPGFRDKLESFFLAETLKYFYLLFEDSIDYLSLDKYVFNTEGHALPIYSQWLREIFTDDFIYEICSFKIIMPVCNTFSLFRFKEKKGDPFILIIVFSLLNTICIYI